MLLIIYSKNNDDIEIEHKIRDEVPVPPAAICLGFILRPRDIDRWRMRDSEWRQVMRKPKQVFSD